MEQQRNEESRVWERVLLLADALRSSCASIHTPEQIRNYYSLTIVQMKAIKKIRRMALAAPEGPGLKQLAEELNVCAATASELVDTLVKKDWLVRKQSKSDRRAVCINLSANALKTFENVYEYFDRRTHELLEGVAEENISVMVEVLDLLLNRMKKIGYSE